jgi:hypothetical protein
MRISKLAAASLTAGFLALTAGSFGATAISASAATGNATVTDVYAGSSKVISGLTSGQQQALDVPAGTVSAKVTLADQTAAVLGHGPATGRLRQDEQPWRDGGPSRREPARCCACRTYGRGPR